MYVGIFNKQFYLRIKISFKCYVSFDKSKYRIKFYLIINLQEQEHVKRLQEKIFFSFKLLNNTITYR